MKKIMFLLLLTVPLFSGFAQDTATEKQVETPANKKDFEKAVIETMLENKDFVFLTCTLIELVRL